MPKLTDSFSTGDLVVYKASFLHFLSWHTDVPVNGRVVDGSDPDYPSVLWCDREDPVRVHRNNIILESEKPLEPR